MILTVSVFFPLLRLLIYFLLHSKQHWIELYIMPLLQYREVFDFCSFAFFVISIYVFLCTRQKKLFASVLLNFINTIVCWEYVPGLWLKVQMFFSWLSDRFSDSEGYVIGLAVLIILMLAVMGWRRLDNQLWEQIKSAWSSLRKSDGCIDWLILFVLGSFFLVHVAVEVGYSAGFKVTRIQSLIQSSFGVLAIISAVSMIYICLQLIDRKTDGKQKMFPVIFFDVCLGLWGMASIRSYKGELMLSEERFRDLMLAGVEIFVVFAMILLGAVLWQNTIRYFIRAKERKGVNQEGRRVRFAICVSAIMVVFILIVLMIVFFHWQGQLDHYFDGLTSQDTSLENVMEFWGVIVLFVAIGIIVIGGISLFVYEVFKAVSKRNKRPSEWLVLLVSFVLTALSIYIYYRIEPKGEMKGMAEDVAGVFAFPVVLMAWYVIMTGLLESLAGLLKDPSKIKQKLSEEMEQLILDSISSIFAPFSFSANYLATLRDAIMEDNGTGKGTKALRIRCRNCYLRMKKYLRKRGGMRRCRMTKQGKV